MRVFLFSLLLILIPSVGISQSTKKQLREIEDFMENHIPYNHSGVTGYVITLDEETLTKETLVDDGSSHLSRFDLKTQVTLEMHRIDDEAAEVYGFKDYWEVYIGGRWLHTELLTEREALKLVMMLKNLQDSLD